MHEKEATADKVIRLVNTNSLNTPSEKHYFYKTDYFIPTLIVMKLRRAKINFDLKIVVIGINLIKNNAMN